MSSDDEFIHRLNRFGLRGKEAQLYLGLLKYGPKTPSPLAKSLNTYREDVHRMLASLIEKGLVRPSLDAPTVYVAVDLDTALDSAVKKHECELREMEGRKRELLELSKQQPFQLSDEIGTFRVLKTIKEIISVATPILLSTQKEFLWVVPESGLVSASLWFNEAAKGIIQRGGKALGITDVTYSAMPLVQEVLDIGEEVRHFDGYRGAYYGVFDRKHCISAINIDIKHHRPDEPATMLYADDSMYAQYLVSFFEMLWLRSVPAEQRIRELLEGGPRTIDG